MYRVAAVLFGAEEVAARNPVLELGLLCIGEPPYYLVQRKGISKTRLFQKNQNKNGDEIASYP